MKTFIALLLLSASILATGCSINEQLARSFIMNHDTTDTEWIEYVQNDDTLSDDAKEDRRRNFESAELLRDELAEEIDYKE